MSVALFEQISPDVFVPTDHSRGPWDPAHCHGGPVAALLTRAVERHQPGDTTWTVARITIELTRPVPVGRELRLDATLERPGRRVSLIGAILSDGETEVARVRGLRIRTGSLPIPADTILPTDRLRTPPDESRPERMLFGAEDGTPITSFATSSCEHRFAAGSWLEPGPVEVWIRLEVPVLADEEPSGAQRVAAAADFGNGVSAVLPWDDYLFINPDLTVHLLRQPQGDWVGLRSVTHLADAGVGLAESAIHDEIGPIGRSVQSLYLDRR